MGTRRSGLRNSSRLESLCKSSPNPLLDRNSQTSVLLISCAALDCTFAIPFHSRTFTSPRFVAYFQVVLRYRDLNVSPGFSHHSIRLPLTPPHALSNSSVGNLCPVSTRSGGTCPPEFRPGMRHIDWGMMVRCCPAVCKALLTQCRSLPCKKRRAHRSTNTSSPSIL